MGIIIKEIDASKTWDLRHRVMWPDKPVEYVKLEEDKDGVHFGLFEDGQLRSIVSLFVFGQEAQFRKFATDNLMQGRGYGSKLLEHLMGVVQQQNIVRVWCNARLDKVPFYKRFGMVEVGEEFIKGGINYVKMQTAIFT